MIPFVLGAAFGAISERYGLPIPNYKTIFTVKNVNENIDGEAFSKARQILIEEEGKKDVVYLDTLGNLTVGIGHKVLPSDNLKFGDKISELQINVFFVLDSEKAFNAAREQAAEINKYTVDMIARLTSVNFQLGTNWRIKFPNTWSLIKNGEIDEAINLLVNSAWYKQTPVRVTNFIVTLQNQFA